MVRPPDFYILLKRVAGDHRAPQVEFPKTGAIQEKPPALEPQRAVEKQEKTVIAKPAQTAPKQDVPIAVEPSPPPAVPPATAATNGNAVKPEAPVVKPAAKAPASPPPLAQKKENAVLRRPKRRRRRWTWHRWRSGSRRPMPSACSPSSRSRTQVDDLLNQFRAYYQGRVKPTPGRIAAAVRPALLKVLSLLAGRRSPLARAITESREAIWGILF